MNSVVVIAGVVTNILSVVGIVITNKYITDVDRFHYMVFLSFLHFLFTTVGTRVLLYFGVFSYKEAPFSGILPVAAGSLLSVGFMNLNLAYNSVGFYQVCKRILARIYIEHLTMFSFFHFVAVEASVYSVHLVCSICCIQAIRF